MLEFADEVMGAAELIAWFGHWPDFHDAEVLECTLRRTEKSTIRIHTFETTNKAGKNGLFITTKHVIVSFLLEGVTDLHLEGFNSQNVISGLLLEHSTEGYQITLCGSYGIQGTITANRVYLDLQPGLPTDSQYLELDTI
jgi:hypothetical protein